MLQFRKRCQNTVNRIRRDGVRKWFEEEPHVRVIEDHVIFAEETHNILKRHGDNIKENTTTEKAKLTAFKLCAQLLATDMHCIVDEKMTISAQIP